MTLKSSAMTAIFPIVLWTWRALEKSKRCCRKIFFACGETLGTYHYKSDSLNNFNFYLFIYYYYLFSIYLINHVPNRILHKGKTLHTVKETIYKNSHRVFKNAFLHISAWCSSSLHYQWCRWYFSAWRSDEIQRALN